MIKKFALIGIITLLIFGCSQIDENIIIFDEVSSSKEVKMSYGEDSPGCAVHLKLAYATEENGHKADVINDIIMKRLLNMSELTMKQAADSFASNYTASYKNNFLPLFNQDRADTTKHSWYNYHYVITSQTQQGGKGTTSYIATIDYYEGGARSINMQKTILFNNQDGQEITLNDIFVGGYEKTLTSILQKSLQDKIGVKDMKELNNKGYLYNMKMFPSENFILNDEAITFIYNPSEIASYDKGSIELTISLNEVKKILKKQYQ